MAEQTFQSTKDSYIRNTSPTSNQGSNSSLIYGQAGTSTYRTPIAFDVSSMPSGSVVKYAYLDLTVSTSIGAGETFEIRRLTKDWTELQVTWNNANTGDAWDTAGGDFVEDLGVDFTLPPTGATAINVTALVQDAFQNRGGLVNLLIKSSTETTPNHYNVTRSRDYSTVADRPRLVVEYDLSPYVELRESLTFNNSSADTWQEKNIFEDFGIPDEAVLEIMMTNDDQTTENNAGIRTSGSSVSRLWDLHEAEGGGVDAVSAHVKMTNGVIETYSENTTNVEFTILGYWIPGSCDFVEVSIPAITVTNNATWENQDLSSVGITDGDIVEIHFYNTATSSELEGGAREVGSTLDRRVDIHEAEGGGRDWAGMLVKASGSDGTIQVYLENDARLIGLVYGYFPAESLPGEWTEKFELITDAAFAGTWEQKTESDIPNPSESESGVTIHAMLENTADAAAHFMGIRDPNSTHNRYVELQESEGGGSDFVSMHVHVSGQQYDIWTDFASSSEPRMLGYWLTAKPTGVASGDLDLFIHGHDDTAPRLYWITDDSDIIGESRLDGSNSGVLATFSSFSQPGKLANDKDPKRPVYYILTTDNDLFEIDDDGNTNTLYSTGFSDKGIEVDHARGIVIFSENATVTSGAIDGSASGILFDDNTINNDPIDAIELDLICGNLYYIYNDSSASKQTLYRRDYPVISDREQIYFNQDATRSFTDFAISVSDGKIYVLESDFTGPTSRIRSMNLDGSDVTTIWTKSTVSAGIGIHIQSRSLFVGAITNNTIVRVDMDTGDETTILNDAAAGTDDPRDVIVQPDWATSLFTHGHEPASGNVDLFIHGCESASGQIDCTITGHDVVSGDIPLVITGHTPSSGDIDLYIGGVSGSSGNIDLYIGGVSGASGDIPLVMTGASPSSGDMDLYIGGVSGASGNVDLYIGGVSGASGDIPLVIGGSIPSSGDIDLYIGGVSGVSGDITLFIHGTPSGDITLFIDGEDGAVDDIDLFIKGKPSGSIDLYVGGSSGVSGDITLFIQGAPSGDIPLFIDGEGGATGDVDLFIQGKPSGEIDLYIGGSSGVSGQIDLFISGALGTSGDMPLVMVGFDSTSGDINLFVQGKPSGEMDLFIGGSSGVSGSLDLFIGGISGTSGDVTLVIIGEGPASGDIPLFIKGQPSGELDLFIVGSLGVSGSIPLFISGPSGSSGAMDLVITGSGIIPFSGNLDLFIHGIIEKPFLSCPVPLPTDAFQVTNELISIYQDRIDAMINQIGKNVILEFDPVQVVCPNCHFDPQRNRSSGRPKSGGPRPFKRGRQCPYCKGRGFVETPQEKCIKALVRWNPQDLATYRISIRGRKSIVRLKTLLTDAVDLERANTLRVDPDQSSMVVFRVKKIKGPVLRGLRDDRYAVSFWELL